MSKMLKTLIVSAMFSMIFVITSFAGTWKQDAKGWWWDYGNGTWPVAKCERLKTSVSNRLTCSKRKVGVPLWNQ